MKIGVLSPNNGWGTRQLVNTGKQYFQTEYISFEKFTYNIENYNFFLDYDAIILKGIHGEIHSYYLDYLSALEKDILLINPLASILQTSSKFYSTLILNRNNYPVPPTLITTEIEKAFSFIKQYKEVLIKPIYGKGGNRIELLSIQSNDWKSKISKWLVRNSLIYLQKFIHFGDKDIRTFVVGNNFEGAMYRKKREDSFLTNISSGGIPIECPVTTNLTKISISVSNLFKLDFAGIDLIPVDSDKYIILEVNGCPGWWGISQVTSENIAEKIIRHVVKKIKKM